MAAVGESMDAFCVSGTVALEVAPGAIVCRGMTWWAGARPNEFLLNWIMKVSRATPAPFWNSKAYTAEQQHRL